MVQELKKDIKAVVLSEYKLMVCILVMLIIFWKFINKLISTYIVCITETVSNDSVFIALIFFLCPIFIALIKRDYLKREQRSFPNDTYGSFSYLLFTSYLRFGEGLIFIPIWELVILHVCFGECFVRNVDSFSFIRNILRFL